MPYGIRFVLIAAVVGLSACATSSRQPYMHQASITPEPLHPGDTAIVTVKLDDYFEIVERVEGVVAEDGTILFRLHDDGIDPDVKADDGIWSIKVEVPFNAPPGEFNFTLHGYDNEGNRILIFDEMNETAPLTSTFQLRIEYPEISEEAVEE